MRSVVSVIIPTYNRGPLLGRAIDSALHQTHSAVEIVVVDDGSTDDTHAILQARYAGDPRIKLIAQDNRGVAAARNRALAAATGDFIAFLDSDDYWQPWKLEVQVACLTQRPEAGMVWTDMASIGPDGSQVEARYLRRMYSAYDFFPDNTAFQGAERLGDIMADVPAGLDEVAVRWARLGGAMIAGNMVHTSTVMLTRQRLDRIGRFDETLSPAGEDYDFHLRTCEAGPVGLIDVSSIGYQVGLSDRLTLNRRVLALNYLLTSGRALARLPASERMQLGKLRRIRAAGHAWLGAILLEEGDRAGARHHLLQTLFRNPFQLRKAAELTAAILPERFYRAASAMRAVQRKQRQTKMWPDLSDSCPSV